MLDKFNFLHSASVITIGKKKTPMSSLLAPHLSSSSSSSNESGSSITSKNNKQSTKCVSLLGHPISCFSLVVFVLSLVRPACFRCCYFKTPADLYTHSPLFFSLFYLFCCRKKMLIILSFSLHLFSYRAICQRKSF